ncbi:MAG: type II toxin-antitoxin system VapC family toxin [Daejeonella sp.]
MVYKNIFIDSDILLDIFLQREPFYQFGQKLLNMGNNKEIKISTSVLIIANIYYITAKALGKSEAKDIVNKLLKMITVLPLDAESISLAMNSNFGDVEDAIQHFIAMRNDCEVIITRNLKHYIKSMMPVMSAEQYIRTV